MPGNVARFLNRLSFQIVCVEATLNSLERTVSLTKTNIKRKEKKLGLLMHKHIEYLKIGWHNRHLTFFSGKLNVLQKIEVLQLQLKVKKNQLKKKKKQFTRWKRLLQKLAARAPFED